MPREQKTRSKAFQKSKQRVAATQATQTTTDVTTDDTQVTNDITTTNASDASDAIISAPPEQAAVEQSTTSHKQVVWPGLQPSWLSWPSSKPGPRSTPPMPGTRPINSLRPEQFKEIGYNQQIGEPATQDSLRSHPDERTSGSTSFDQPTAQDVVGKRKQRL